MLVTGGGGGCKFAAASVPLWWSVCGCHLVGDRLLGALVADPLEALAVELVET